MAKRSNRIAPIEHEQRQLETLKTLTPNTTPQRYQPLSNGIIDVAITALDIVAALEEGGWPNFERFYNQIDALTDLVEGEVEELEAVEAPLPATLPIAKKTSTQGATNVSVIKTTVVGRPDHIETQGDTVVLRLKYLPKPSANGQYGLPKGVPAPSNLETSVLAYVGKKQFEKVKAQLDNPEDVLIIEGAISQVIGGVLTVYASNVTSKLLQAAKKDEQQKSGTQQKETTG